MECKNKELRIGFQLLAVIAIWLVWLLTAVLVVWRELKVGSYEDRLYVYAIVFVAIPIVSVVFGVITMRGVDKIADLGIFLRVLYFFTGLLVTAEAILVFLYCSAWCLGLLRQVRQ